jgi:hypothetical protein
MTHPLRFLTAATLLAAAAQLPAAEPGFTPLFDCQSLDGWRGGDTFDPRKYWAMPAAERAAQDEKWTADMRQHWRAVDGVLVNDGNGKYATTTKDYGDIDLTVDYKTVPKADSGIYLRGCPQVQIWDYTESAKFGIGAGKGSGGLWNNLPGAPGKDPLALADKPFGEWNSFRIRQLGARTWITLNGKLVVDGALMGNYYDRQQPIPPKGPIELQTHGGEISWKNIAVREIPPAEANKLLRGEDPVGFKSVFNGQDFTGWEGPVDNYEIKDGAIVCKAGKGGTIYTKDDYTNFVVRLEFKLPPGGNNGLAIRYAGTGDTAYAGLCELQVLDDNYEKATGQKLDPRQAHGSAYGMVAAARGYQRPIGEWNYQEVTVIGSKLKVELNGTVILDTDLADAKDFMAGSAHPGKDRTVGRFGFAGHNDPVMFRNISIKPLN